MRKLTYSVVPRKNPADKGAPAKYYATAQARGYSSLEEIAEKISRSTTVTRADVKAVLAASRTKPLISCRTAKSFSWVIWEPSVLPSAPKVLKWLKNITFR